MKKLLILFFCGIVVQQNAYSQCQDINFDNACGGTTTTSDNCPYFSGTCNANWGHTNGSPQMISYLYTWPKSQLTVTKWYAFMWSAKSGSSNVGEGMFYSYNFYQGTPLTVTVHCATNVQGGCSGGVVNVWAMTGFTQPSPSATHCGDPTPNIPSTQKQLIGTITALNSNLSQDYVFTIVPTQHWNQLWIDPEATCSTGQYNLALSDIQICSGCAATTTFNLGSVQIPSGQILAYKILAGSSAPSGGSGVVTIQSAQQTQFIGVNEIDLLPEFQAIITGTGYFGATIQSCGYVPPIFQTDVNYDSVKLQIGTVGVEGNITKSVYIPGQTNEDPNITDGNLYSKLSVFPTVTSGTIHITGRTIDLENSEITIVDGQGRVVDKISNKSNTSITLNFNRLRNGIYYIQVKNALKSETKKFIIDK